MQHPTIHARILSHDTISLPTEVSHGGTLNREGVMATQLIDVETALGTITLPLFVREQAHPEGTEITITGNSDPADEDCLDLAYLSFAGVRGTYEVAGLSDYTDTYQTSRRIAPSDAFINTRLALFSDAIRVRTNTHIGYAEHLNRTTTPSEFQVASFAMNFLPRTEAPYFNENQHDATHTAKTVLQGDEAFAFYCLLARKFVESKGLELPTPEEYDEWERTVLSDFAQAQVGAAHRYAWEKMGSFLDSVTDFHPYRFKGLLLDTRLRNATDFVCRETNSDVSAEFNSKETFEEIITAVNEQALLQRIKAAYADPDHEIHTLPLVA